jgi:hypothetical protein
MLRTAVERRLRDTHERDGYLFPAYDSYCFGNVPGTVASLLGVDDGRTLPPDVFDGVGTDVDRVVLVVVDGYGLDSFERDRSGHPFLQRLVERGVVTPLTSVYPSETAAAITTLQTGQLPCEHGQLGWNVYDPKTDRSFLALSAEVKAGDDASYAPEAWEAAESQYERLAAAGVDCHRLQPFPGENRGVSQHQYDGLDAFGDRLGEVLAVTDAPGYVYAYLPHVDGVSHADGTTGESFQQTVADVCDGLTAFVEGVDPETAASTLLLVTADHGHVNTDPDRNVDLGGFETVVGNLRRHGDGTPVRLSGSPRNVHLHLQPGTVEETRAALADLDARVVTRGEALDSNRFGDRPVSETFRRRCGDLVVTHRELGAWFADVEPAELDLVGMHGGLHPDEMLVPFAAVRVDRLQS